MEGEPDVDVLIVGAGAIGTCTAMKLSSDHEVLVVDKGDMTNNATANAAAFISDWWALLGYEFVSGAYETIYDFFSELDGTDLFDYHEYPYVTLIEGELDEQATTQFEKLRTISEKVDGINYYSTGELESRWPGIINLDGISGAIVDESAGAVDPVNYLMAMKQEAKKKGAQFRTQTEVDRILTEGTEVHGVEIADTAEQILADQVIVAAGTHSSDLVEEFVDLPVREFAIYGVRLSPQEDVPDDMPIVADEEMMTGPDAYGNFSAGVEFWIEGPQDIPSQFPWDAIQDAALHIPELIHGFGSMQLMQDRSHHCPEGITITPDQLPVIDSLDTPSGLFVADGSRGAVSMAPAIAEVIRSLVTSEETPLPIDRFRIDRFGSETEDYSIPFVADQL